MLSMRIGDWGCPEEGKEKGFWKGGLEDLHELHTARNRQTSALVRRKFDMISSSSFGRSDHGALLSLLPNSFPFLIASMFLQLLAVCDLENEQQG